MTGLLALSLVQAYWIQSTLSEETVQIYHRHIKQDDLISRLRRTLWIGANLSRDYLVYPYAESASNFRTQLANLKGESSDLLNQLEALPDARQPSPALRPKIDEFWAAMAAVPDATRGLDPVGRYDFIQRVIVPKRNSVGDIVREFAELGQNALKQSELEFALTRRENARRLLLVLVISLVLGVAVAGFSVLHSDALEKQSVFRYEQVERARAELRQLSARLMEIQEQERARISRDLHDEVGQLAATVRLEIARAESLSPQRSLEIRQHLAYAKELAARSVESIRNICVLLRPTILDDLGLSPALQWQAQDFTRRTGVPCDFQEEDVADVLPDAIKTCVFRVLQESLHNCEKHSAATKVEVRVRQLESGITLEVRDDGRGFDVEARDRQAGRAHLGIMGMRERATTLGGEFHVASEAGRGTRILLRLPVAARQEHAPAGSEVHA